ncbi:MAG: hypothetical protein K8R68_09475 [Bacteroidales bacterium]|nr:hypothetical protein [Bacteroidales bacterium]
MKKSILTFLILAIAILTFAQRGKKESEPVAPTEKNIHVSIYQKALKYGDANTAINSLLYIITTEGDQSAYRDSLAFLYFNVGRYASCELVCREILKSENDKAGILEMMAISQKSLGKTIEAISSYEKLLPLTNNIYHAYNLAELQYTIKRLGEAYITIQIAEQSECTENDKISFNMGQNQTQQVQLKAAIYNLKGLIEYELDPENKDVARQSFEKALQIEPEFLLAKNNLSIFNTEEEIPEENK